MYSFLKMAIKVLFIQNSLTEFSIIKYKQKWKMVEAKNAIKVCFGV